jgi:hypothetical protein
VLHFFPAFAANRTEAVARSHRRNYLGLAFSMQSGRYLS